MKLRELINALDRARNSARRERILAAIMVKERTADAFFASAYYVPALDVHVHASVVRRNQTKLVRRIDFGRNGMYA